MRQEMLRARLGEREEELKEYQAYKEGGGTTIQDGRQDMDNIEDGNGILGDGRRETEGGSETDTSGNRDTRGTSTNKEDNGEPKMYEEEMDDEWERNIREDEEVMERELMQQQESMDTWLEKEEHELARDKFGDG